MCYLSVMRRLSLTKLILAWMIIWLPISGTLAAVMPLSNMTIKQFVPLAEADSDSLTSIGAPEMPCHGDLKKQTQSQACSHCALCHLTASIAFDLPAMHLPRITQIFSTASYAAHVSFIPDLPNPPPRFSLA